MTADLLPRTACGLYVVRDGEHRKWSNFSWLTQVVDMEGDQENRDALALAGQEVMGQFGQHAGTGRLATPQDVAFAALHPGHVDRVEYADLDYADPEVLAETVNSDGRRMQRPWTVCGLIDGTWRTFCHQVEAGIPPVAYFRAWEYARDEHGGYLLLAAVHEGHHAALPTFGYADPWISDPAVMAAKARDEWGVR